jgi:predicted Zn-dependent protease
MSVMRCLLLVDKLNLFSHLSLLKRHVIFLFLPLLLSSVPDVFADSSSLACTDDHQAAKKVSQRIENEWPLRSSGDEVTQYIQNLGVHLAQLKGYGNAFPWHFSVVRNLAPNAFSIGGGYVFVTEGAISFAETESELAAILAHEIGHELAGHFCVVQVPNVLVSLYDDLFRPKPEQHQIGVGSLTQVIDVDKEQQADRIALSIIKTGGYDPSAMIDLARRMPSNGNTHLIDASRIHVLEKALADLPAQPAKSSNEFLAIKRNLAFQ